MLLMLITGRRARGERRGPSVLNQESSVSFSHCALQSPVFSSNVFPARPLVSGSLIEYLLRLCPVDSSSESSPPRPPPPSALRLYLPRVHLPRHGLVKEQVVVHPSHLPDVPMLEQEPGYPRALLRIRVVFDGESSERVRVEIEPSQHLPLEPLDVKRQELNETRCTSLHEHRLQRPGPHSAG